MKEHVGVPADDMATPRSYRDPMSRVLFSEGLIVRHFSAEAADWFQSVENTGLFSELVDDGLLQPYETSVLQNGSIVVISPRIPFVTYPAEWTTGMLRDAGLLTLEIVRRAWDREVNLRDASAFNVVFDGGRPVFVDHGSFRPGHTSFWLAYGQFCDHFLNPLALNALTGAPQRSVWHSSLEGLPAQDLRRLLGLRAARRGLFKHVYLRAALESRGDRLDRAARSELRSYEVPPARTRLLMERMTKHLRRLEPTATAAWVGYERSNTYSSDEEAHKLEALRRLVSFVEPRKLVVDLGANAGKYSAALADQFERVVAIDFAEGAVEQLYQRVKSGEVAPHVTPAVTDLLDPTPARGLMNEERLALFDRLAGADLFVWLALIHHLVISRGVPLGLVMTMARRLGKTHIIEHVGPEDPMSRLLAASRPETSWPLDRATFEQAIHREFVIVRKQEVTAYRQLYLLEAR